MKRDEVTLHVPTTHHRPLQGCCGLHVTWAPVVTSALRYAGYMPPHGIGFMAPAVAARAAGENPVCPHPCRQLDRTGAEMGMSLPCGHVTFCMPCANATLASRPFGWNQLDLGAYSRTGTTRDPSFRLVCPVCQCLVAAVAPLGPRRSTESSTFIRGRGSGAEDVNISRAPLLLMDPMSIVMWHRILFRATRRDPASPEAKSLGGLDELLKAHPRLGKTHARVALQEQLDNNLDSFLNSVGQGQSRVSHDTTSTELVLEFVIAALLRLQVDLNPTRASPLQFLFDKRKSPHYKLASEAAYSRSFVSGGQDNLGRLMDLCADANKRSFLAAVQFHIRFPFDEAQFGLMRSATAACVAHCPWLIFPQSTDVGEEEGTGEGKTGEAGVADSGGGGGGGGGGAVKLGAWGAMTSGDAATPAAPAINFFGDGGAAGDVLGAVGAVGAKDTVGAVGAVGAVGPRSAGAATAASTAAATGASKTLPSPKLGLRWHNPHLNPRQKLAVEKMVTGSHGRAPHVVFGPPGTGKTTTMIEALYQLICTNPTTRLLVTAPSEIACDILAERLLLCFNGGGSLTIVICSFPVSP